MILTGLLSESTNQFQTDEVEAIIKPHYTPNQTGMQSILVESLEDQIRLEENVMLAEQIMATLKAKGNEEAYEQLSEGVVGDYFNKAIEALKRLWAKIKGWFANLFKSIETGTRDITKLIEKYKKELHGKDYSNFEYSGHAWVSGAIEKFHASITSEIEKESGEMEGPTTASIETLEAAVKDLNNMTTDHLYGLFLGKNEEMSASEAAKEIAEKAHGGETKKIKGFQHESLDDMINYVKNFKNSKTIKKAETDTNKVYNKLIADANKQVNAAQKAINTANNVDAETKKKGELAVSVIRAGISMTQRSLSVYNSLTATCVGLEKERFTEYKKVIAAAIRHKG